MAFVLTDPHGVISKDLRWTERLLRWSCSAAVFPRTRWVVPLLLAIYGTPAAFVDIYQQNILWLESLRHKRECSPLHSTSFLVAYGNLDGEHLAVTNEVLNLASGLCPSRFLLSFRSSGIFECKPSRSVRAREQQLIAVDIV